MRAALAWWAALWIAIISPCRAHAQAHLAEPWVEVRTEHFVVLAHRGVAVLAPEVAQMAEAAHARLEPVFGARRGRTTIVLSDAIDSANGSAGVLPYRTVNAWGFAPEADSTLGFHDNWMWNLLVHEYTHILHLDTMGRAWRVANVPFGARWAPNQYLPRWFIEGIATWQESLQSGTGRIQNAHYQQQLRVTVAGGQAPRLGSLSGFPEDWPYAGAWYLFGAFFVDWMADRFGDDVIPRVVQRYGRRAVPYGFSTTLELETGLGLPELYSRFMAEASVHAALDFARRAAEGPLTAYESVTMRGHNSGFVTLDARCAAVAWMVDDGHSHPRLVREHEGVTLSVRVEQADPFALVPCAERAVLSLPVSVAQGYAFADLFELDLRTGAMRRITRGLRAREPAVSPDGTQVAFVRATEGRADLWTVGVDGRGARLLATAGDWSLFATPAFSADGTWLVASLHRPGFGRDIVRIELSTGQVTTVATGTGEALSPVLVDNDAWVLFSDDRGAYREIVAHELATGQEAVVTRGTGAVFTPVLRTVGDAARLWVRLLGPSGYDVAVTTVRWPPRTAVAEAAIERGSGPGVWTERTVGASRRARSARMFVPSTWRPGASVAGGQWSASLSASNHDPTGRLAVSGVLAFSSVTDTPTGSVAARLGMLPLGLRLSAARVLEPRAETWLEGEGWQPFWEEQWLGSVGTDVVFARPGGAHSLSVEWSLARVRALDAPEVSRRPEDVEPSIPTFASRDSLAVSWGWGNARAPVHAISPETGWSVGATTRVRAPWTGAAVESIEFLWGGRAFVALPWFEHHVLALRGAGAFGRSRGTGRRLYALGGPTVQDVVMATINGLPSGSAHVRGYSPAARSGDHYVLGSAEYRLPLWRMDAGVGSLPLVFEELSLAAFCDVGMASDGALRGSALASGVGAELRLGTTFGYVRGAAFRFGVARGLAGAGARTSVYVLYGWPF